ncbi:Choline O-acetyltransferase-like Protein [Gryllus bimaculatus]|nr:Choline O-acetyltransferase-like Protein [Gryllus bimaculatus]
MGPSDEAMLKLMGPINASRGQALFTFSKNLWNVNSSSVLRATVGYQHALHPRLLSSQSDLPPLPVPPLQVTLDKFLRSARPLVTPEEFQTTQDLVKQFSAAGGCGPKLQKLLEEKAKTTRNWLADWWLRTAYLEFRYPVVVWSSPGLVFPHQKVCNQDEQLTLAARVISGAVDFKCLIDNNKLPLERMGKDPLDMSQYSKIMGTCRIPGIPRDSLQHADPCNPPKHVVVAYKNHFFEVAVYGENGEPLSEDQIREQLCEIVSGPVRPAVPIGILTSDQRDNWGKAYQELIKDPKNVCSLETIQKSLFLVCLDDPNPNFGSLDKRSIAARQMVHGCGSKNNGANRWFDKTIQFVIGTTGELGITYEHSPAEGPPCPSYFLVFVFSNKGGLKLSTSGCVPKPNHLPFNTSSELQCAIQTAEKNLDAMVDDLEMYGYVYKGYGKEFPKSQKMSPDSFIQMAIQFAFYRLHKLPGAHYESASTRKYFGGRTETIRSCSCESVAFAETMLDCSKSDEEKVKAMKEAVNGHKKYTLEAVNGCGVDRHLLGLKLIALENGIQVPELYKDVAYVRSSHMRISTSQVAGKCEAFMCYGPLVNDGYACCYNPRANEIHMGISAFKSCPDTSASKFKDALEESFDDMHNVLVKTQKSKL